MEHKVEALTNFLKETISGWSNVECITTDPRSEIFAYDPYFALVIDVYCSGKVPSSASRRDAFGDPGDFETAAGRTKDRFFLQEMPIRIEYKDIASMNKLVASPTRHLKLLKNSGTYPFYRIQHNKVIFDASGWLERIRLSLGEFPDTAWEALLDSFSAKMEHYLSDMGAASFSGDKFFLLLSEAGFLRYTAASIFMVNRLHTGPLRNICEISPLCRKGSGPAGTQCSRKSARSLLRSVSKLPDCWRARCYHCANREETGHEQESLCQPLPKTGLPGCRHNPNTSPLLFRKGDTFLQLEVGFGREPVFCTILGLPRRTGKSL
jgi:hypothetical protein